MSYEDTTGRESYVCCPELLEREGYNGKDDESAEHSLFDTPILILFRSTDCSSMASPWPKQAQRNRRINEVVLGLQLFIVSRGTAAHSRFTTADSVDAQGRSA